jgi:hypothetical protein
MLVCRQRGMSNFLLTLHGIQDRMNEALISRVKTLRKRLRQRKQAT